MLISKTMVATLTDQPAPFQPLEPAYDLLAVGHTALKTASECSFTVRKLRFLGRFCLVWL